MRRLLCHTLVVAAVLFVGDDHFNDGRDRHALLTALSADAAVQQAQLQAYHFNAAMGRHLAVLRPAGMR